MILVSDVINGIKAELDAVGSDRYTNDRDYFPALNKAQEWLVTLFNAAFGTNKITEESLRELIVTRIYVCNQFSRLNLYDTIDQSDTPLYQDYIWSILGVHPNCKVIDEIGDLAPDPTLFSNKLRSVKTAYLMAPDKDNKTAERLSLEEWEFVDDNIFMRGNGGVTNGYASYSYLNWKENAPLDPGFTIYDQSQSTGPEIEIKPVLSNKYVGVTYLATPAKILNESDIIKFPETLRVVLIQKSVDYITRKSYDREALYQITTQDMNNLISLMT